MTQTLYSAFQGMNPEVVTVGTLLGLYDPTTGDGGTINDDEDLFQCGKCKKQFYSLGTFMLHKKTHQLAGNVSATQKTLTENLVNDASNEPDMQLQPIILTESDYMSFSIGQAGLNLSISDQGLHGFEENESLMMPDTDDSELKGPKDMNSRFELKSTQIILTTQITNEEPMERLLLADTEGAADVSLLDQPINYLDSEPLIVAANDIEEDEHRREQEETDTALKNGELKLTAAKLEKLKCPYCFKQFTKNFDLQQHLRTHTGDRPFQCVVCGRSFTQKSNVKKHMATHKVWPQRIRTLPEKPIQKISTLTSGEAVVVDESFACQYCPATFKSFIQLKSHRKSHANSKIFKCVQKNCGLVFETLDLFLEHTAAHQTDCDTQYNCCHCKQQFTSLDELGNHQRLQGSCIKKKQCIVMCKLCKSKFASPEALERHLTEDSHSYTCPECGKVYVCERHLRRHLICHSSVPAHPCLECGKTFKTAQNLSIHRLTHSTERPFVCEFCPATFARQDRLMRHTLIHDTKKRYKCPFSKHLGCKKEFYRKDKLKQHMLTHSVSKSLKCKRCSRVFKRTSQLKQHEAVCLSEDKPCKDCGHVTTSLDNYKKNSVKVKERTYVNRRKYRLLESGQRKDDGVPTIQVVVVPLSAVGSEVLTDTTQNL